MKQAKDKTNKMNKTGERLAGVLMPVSALPSREGIGTFGKESYHFVDVLSKMGMSIWQILPLNPLGYGNSPYQPFSSYAGDELYVDLELLAEKGYLKKSAAPLESQGRVDYDAARKFKEPYLREAFAEFRKTVSLDAGYASFCKLDWVKPYAVFISLKRANDMRCWNEWPKEQQNWILDGKYDLSELADEIAYQMFLQYMFYVQWNELKAYANGKGILIMGDIPFYVGIDSLDVWKAREDFLLDQDGRPRFIAGVPPDYFSATGQRWGNPIYDWEHLEQNHFQFWIDRLAYSTKLYDILRIDHFRAFDTYWRIPASCPTAVSGEWLEAPGYKLFDTIYEQLPDAWIVAEDLGELRPEVLVLRDHYGLMGMFIAEFSLLYEEAHKNRLIYTGTHDNQTVKGWYVDMDRQMRAQVDAKLKPYGKPGDSVVNRMLHYVLESEADMAVIPAMDVLELDDSARLNTPGTVGSPNWEWRMESLEAMEERIEWMREMVLESKRGRKE